MRVIILAAFATLGLASPAAANPSDTVGQCIAEGFYGNEPNIVDPYAPGGPSDQAPGTVGGRVVPSQSPGPWVNTDPPTMGSSLGDYHDAFEGGGLATLSDFCPFY